MDQSPLKQLDLLLITNSPDVARYATQSGVGRIFVDMEHIGKAQRQPGVGTVKNFHTPADVQAIRAVCPQADILVRINPLYEGTASEVEQVIQAGASIIMLPMCTQLAEVDALAALIAGRVKCCPLIETWSAVEQLHSIANHPGVDELYVGLNDLAIASGKVFMFQSLVDGSLCTALTDARQSGKPFGVGGVARMGAGLLPAELIIAEHARLGSTRVILSQAFHNGAKTVQEFQANIDLATEVSKIQRHYQAALAWPAHQVEQIHQQFVRQVNAIASKALQS
ncbi:MAG TPA: aldolase/citrate lyase family protein [Limnobacter sp.]|nr:aldolase/citrate lyase family protein [Limnobacter sp.]